MDRHLINYLPDVIKKSRIFDKITSAEDPEFKLKWQSLIDVKCNGFVETASGDGLERYEKILNITPSSNDTLESRRKRILARLNSKFRYDWESLINQARLIYGDDAIDGKLDVNHYTANLDTDIAIYGGVNEVYALFRRVLSSNIAINLQNKLVNTDNADVYTASTLVEGYRYTLTSDINAAYNISAKAVNNSAIVDGTIVTLS